MKSQRKAAWLAAAGLCALLSVAPGEAYPIFDENPDLSVDPVAAFEYYNADTDQYFLTISQPEVDALESGAIAGWKRMGPGQAFLAFDVAVRARGVEPSRAGTHPVCRYFIPPTSHFLSASEEECEAVGRAYPEFVLETKAAFHVFVPDSAGACPQLVARIGGFEFQPVYRLWDQHRNGVEHRLTASKPERDALIAQGWVSEGYGADGVAMCVPAWQ